MVRVPIKKITEEEAKHIEYKELKVHCNGKVIAVLYIRK